MGTFKKGILGGFSGKVGTVVGASWNGIDYMRSLPKKSSKPATQLQLDVRDKFTLVSDFLSPILALINVGYQSFKNGKVSPYNAASSDLLKNAITGVSPNFSLDYSKVVYSRGELSGPWSPEVETGLNAQITFNWLATPVSPLAQPTDKLTLMVYNPIKQRVVYLQGAAIRSALTANMQLPLEFTGDEVQCYMSFVSADGKKVSSSFYLGELVVV